MYGLPGSPIQFGSKLPPKKRGRPSALSKFLENQRDLFPVDLYTAKLSSAALAGGDKRAVRPQRSEDGGAQRRPFPPATKRGGKVKAENIGTSDKPLNPLKKCMK